ncbi:MAG: PAS domain S-box protein [Elusimicrobia bacterium]|nr:PAS domain S-box protein [Elusimicrobiota bacterium]
MTIENAKDKAVLIVEDDEPTAELEKQALTRAGLSVRVTDKTDKAVALLRSERFGTVLLDYQLSGGDPWSVLEAAQTITPRVPVVLVTGMDDEKLAAEAIQRGVHYYVKKTYDFHDQLPQILERIFQFDENDRKLAQLAAIVESFEDAIYSRSLDGILTSWNHGAQILHGYSAEEVVGKSFTMLLPPGKEREAQDLLQPRENIHHFETTLLHKDGRPLEVSLTLSPIKNKSGQMTGVSVIARDITKEKTAQKELESSASLLRTTLDSTADGILVVDTRGKITLFNQKFVQMWRIPATVLALRDDDKALAFTIDQLETPAAFLAKVKELYAHPEAESWDMLKFKDGRIFERFSQPQRLQTASGRTEIVGRIWSFRDVTASKLAEQALQTKLQELEELNKLMLGREDRILELKEEVKRLDAELKTMAAGGGGRGGYGLVIIRKPIRPFRDLPIRRKLRLTMVLASLAVLVLTMGSFLAYVYAQDARELHAMLKLYMVVALIIFLAALLLIIAISNVFERLICVPVLNLAAMTQTLAKTHDYSQRVVTPLGNDEIAILVEGFNSMLAQIQDRDRALKKARDTLEQRVLDRTRDLIKANGELVEKNAALEHAQAELLRRDKILRSLLGDINSIKCLLEIQAKDLKRSNEDLEQFAYIASHDLQEPLRMITIYTELLARRYRGHLDTNADEMIAYTIDGATRLQVLIKGLLIYARLGQRQHFAMTDISLPLKNALANLKVAIEESGARIHCAPLPLLIVDAAQMTQLFQNLIGNALKYRSQQEAPEVHIEAAPQPGAWQFLVRDNGIGIDSKYFDRLFILFQRLHSRDEYSGSGLGLAVCKKIAENHGGRIWVQSNPDTGSTFFFTIANNLTAIEA